MLDVCTKQLQVFNQLHINDVENSESVWKLLKQFILEIARDLPETMRSLQKILPIN